MLPRHAAALSVAIGLASSATLSLADRPAEKPLKPAPGSGLREAREGDALGGFTRSSGTIAFDVELNEGPPTARPDDLDTARSFAAKVFALDEGYRHKALSTAPTAERRAKELRRCRGECSVAPRGLELDLVLVVTQKGCALSGELIDLESGLLTGKVAIALPSTCDDASWFEALGELVGRARELDRTKRKLPSRPICRAFSDLPRGRIVLESEPWATVVDEGLLLGSTPLERSLSPGCHKVMLIAGEGPLPRRSKTVPLLVSPGHSRHVRTSLD